jgi:hypothetical protein
MKIEIIKNKEIVFPCLMTSREFENVVLFTAPGVGTLIVVGSCDSSNYIGRYSDNWSFNKYIPFMDKLKLSN